MKLEKIMKILNSCYSQLEERYQQLTDKYENEEEPEEELKLKHWEERMENLERRMESLQEINEKFEYLIGSIDSVDEDTYTSDDFEELRDLIDDMNKYNEIYRGITDVVKKVDSVIYHIENDDEEDDKEE